MQAIHERRTLLSTTVNISHNIFKNNNTVLTQALFNGNMPFSLSDNFNIFNATTDFILFTKRFDERFLEQGNLLITVKQILELIKFLDF